MNLVVISINPDLINQRPGTVWVGYFDPKSGREVRRELYYGGMFPNDIQMGDEVVFVQKEKRERYANPLPPKSI